MNYDPDQHDPQTPSDDLGEPTMPAGLAALLRESRSLESPRREDEAGVQPSVDNAVMAAAREQLGEIEPPRSIFLPALMRTVGTFGLAAAALALIVFFGPSQTRSPNPPAPNTTQNAPLAQDDARLAESQGVARNELARERTMLAFREDDMDALESAPEALAPLADAAPALAGRAGAAPRVTIVDAFSLALALETGKAPGGAIDANRDGTIDNNDVETLANTAVRLERTGLLSQARLGIGRVLGVSFSPALFDGSVLR